MANSVSLQPSTIFRVNDYRFVPQQKTGNSLVLEIAKGGLRMVTGAIGKQQPNAVAVKTPVATIGIRGTGFTVRLCKGDCVMKGAAKFRTDSTRMLPMARSLFPTRWAAWRFPTGKGVYVESANTMPEFTPVYPLTLPEKMPVGSPSPADSGSAQGQR